MCFPVTISQEPPTGEPTAARQAQAGGISSGVSKETPISIYPSLSYGLQETHTTILPWTGYMSAVGMDYTTPLVFEYRMTQPHDMLKTELSTVADGAAYTKGVFNIPFNNSSARDAAISHVFPATLATGASAVERPAWWEYFSKMYEYYTVLGCEYEIVMDNPNTTSGTDLLIGWDYNA